MIVASRRRKSRSGSPTHHEERKRRLAQLRAEGYKIENDPTRNEKVLVGPGSRRSDWVRDLSASVESVIPPDLTKSAEVRVDLMERKDRQLLLLIAGIQLESMIEKKDVHLQFSQTILSARTHLDPRPARMPADAAAAPGFWPPPAA